MASKREADSVTLYDLLLNDPDLPTLIQLQAYRRGQDNDGTSLLTKLVRHPNLDAELDVELSANTNWKIVKGWIEHPDRTIEQVEDLVARERRTSVLMVAAGFPGLSDTTYAQLAERANDKVAVALLRNGAIPMEVRTEAASVLFARLQARNFKRSYKRTEYAEPLVDTISTYPEVSVALTEVTSLLDVVYVAGSPHVDAAFHTEQLDQTLTFGNRWIAERQTRNDEPFEVDTTRRLTDALYEFGTSPHADVAARKRIVAAAQQWHQTLLSEAHRDYYAGKAEMTKVASLHPDQAWKSQFYHLTPARAEVRAASNSDELAAATALTVANNDRIAARLVLSHPAATPEIILKLGKLGIAWTNAKAIALARAREPELVAAICAVNGHAMTDTVLERTGDPSATLALVLHYLGRQEQRLTKSVLASKYLTPEVLRRAPASALLDPDLPGAASHAIGRLLVEALGESEAGWLELEGLVGNYGGTIDELLETVQLLAA